MAARQIGLDFSGGLQRPPQQPADAADLIVLLSRRNRLSQAKVRSTTTAAGPPRTTTIGGVAPGGSQRGLCPPSLHDLEGHAPALACPVQKGPRSPDVGGDHLDLADQAEGVDQQVALAALMPLGAVVAVWPPVVGLDALAVQDGRAEGWAAGLAWWVPCMWKALSCCRAWQSRRPLDCQLVAYRVLRPTAQRGSCRPVSCHARHLRWLA